MILELKRTPGIYLVGFMGAGKSTVGRVLAERLGWRFADLDEDIELAARMSIAEIFDQCGEARFRELETEALVSRILAVRSGQPMVLALGGGAFTQPGNVRLIEESGVSIWLDCPWEIVERRVAAATHRPLARDPVRLAELHATRRASYEKARFRIAVTGDDETATVEEILRLPVFQL